MRTGILLTVAALCLLAPRPAASHCQVPCGIYDDSARIAQMREDTTTIRKAVTSIGELAGKTDTQSMNQLIRWTNTKEIHASHIIEIVSEYFLTQKLKPVAAGAEGRDAYLASLAEHHAVMRAAMKTKQTVDAVAVDELAGAIEIMAERWH
jgi:nickel superoxide dismutase